MPASHTGSPDTRFPVGTVLSIYPGEHRRMAPGGAALTTATVAADRTWTATGLAYDTRYTAAAEVGGRWLSTLFTTPVTPVTNDQIVTVVSEAPVNVRYPEYGALGEGSSSAAEDTAALQQVAALGAPMFIPNGEYRLNSEVVGSAGTTVQGEDRESTLVKASDGVSTRLFIATNLAGFEIRDLTLDGNAANVADGGSDTAQQLVYLVSSSTAGIKRAKLINVRGINAKRIAFYATAGTVNTHPLDVELDIEIEDSGRQGLLIARPTRVVGKARAYSCGDASTDQIQIGVNASDGGSGIDLFAEAIAGGRNGVTFLGVTKFRLVSYTTGNAGQGTVLSEGVRDFIADIRSHDNTGINWSLDPRTADSATLKDVEGIVRAEVSGSGSHGAYIQYSKGLHAIIVARDNTDDGIKLVSCEGVTVEGQSISNDDKGVSVVDGSGTGSGPGGRCYVNVLTRSNGTAFEDTGTTKSDFTGSKDHAGIPSVSSANTTTLPVYGDIVNVTGTTTIATLSPSWVGRRVTLVFAAGVVVTNSSSLKLAGATNFTSTADDTLTLVCDGTNWREVARSVN